MCCIPGRLLIQTEGTLGVIYIIRNPLDVVVSMASAWGLSIDESIDFMASKAVGIRDNRFHLSRQHP
ncbi:MAG TPA: hypothetical protein EYQ20_08555 [candidate division Zixibacteria bacterium]|nr:hypothetical protein [candidate division Zixibacteria bacterium]